MRPYPPGTRDSPVVLSTGAPHRPTPASDGGIAHKQMLAEALPSNTPPPWGGSEPPLWLVRGGFVGALVCGVARVICCLALGYSWSGWTPPPSGRRQSTAPRGGRLRLGDRWGGLGGYGAALRSGHHAETSGNQAGIKRKRATTGKNGQERARTGNDGQRRARVGTSDGRQNLLREAR